jgi:hypothetical protein
MQTAISNRRAPIVEAHPDGSSSLFGERFHSCIALMYFGLGFVVATSCAGWFPEAVDWRNAAGLLTFFAGWVWILMRWYRGSSRNQSA